MTTNIDQTENEVRKWADKMNGAPITLADIKNLVLAVDADGDTRHSETIELIVAADTRHQELCSRVKTLEDSSLTCAERVRAFIEKEHDTRHTEHMASHHTTERRAADPPDAEFTDRRTLDTEDARHSWAMWWLGSKLGYILIAVLITVINIGLNYIWFGRP